ncbi:hypothetical protein [Corynebacterium doosanense]|uniref:Uncharacterized protein n=1 Tax=Corynebacterium doosanense CAU 212 = DSM 45436 TaxID=558173 RepID=A0A097IJ71_9CORY|nr:hypothetical protein [Corynebacterium doosanense]AIT62170.1 hypothetical protein CDOO_01850 [Corynebacterium doosanense CAU 212 = DSM 45436]
MTSDYRPKRSSDLALLGELAARYEREIEFIREGAHKITADYASINKGLLEDKKDLREQITASAAAADAVIEELESQVASLRGELARTSNADEATADAANIAELEDQIGALNRQVDAQFTAIEARDAENTKLSEDIIALQEQIEERTRELETAKNTLYATRLDLSQARKDLADTAANRGDHADRADTLAEKLAAVEAELDDARAAAEAAESLAEEHRTHAVEAKRQHADALGEQKQLAKQAKADAKTIQDLTGQLADAQQSPMGNTAPVPDAAAEKARALVTRAIRTLTNSGGLYDLEKDDAVIVTLREATTQLTNRPTTDTTAPGKEAEK